METQQTKQGNTTTPTETAHFFSFSKKTWAAPGGVQTHVTACTTGCLL